MSHSLSNRPTKDHLLDEIQRWLRVPDSEIDDIDENDERVDALVKCCRPSADESSCLRDGASVEPWHERLLRALLVFMGSMLLIGLLVGGLALLGLPLLEDVTEEAACDTLAWYAYRRSLAYSLVAFSGGILGFSLLVALPALAGAEQRRLRWRLAAVAVLVLIAAVASGEKEGVMRNRLDLLPSSLNAGEGSNAAAATHQCLELLDAEENHAR